MNTKIGIQTWPNGNATYITDDGRYMIIAMMNGWEFDRQDVGRRFRSKIEILDAGRMIYSDEGPSSGVNMPFDSRMALESMINFMDAENDAWISGEPDEPKFEGEVIDFIAEYIDELIMVADSQD